MLESSLYRRRHTVLDTRCRVRLSSLELVQVGPILGVNCGITMLLQAGCPSCHPTNGVNALKNERHQE